MCIRDRNGEIVESTKIPQATTPAEKNVVVVKETISAPNLSPVSYTHLDVYKRQGYSRIHKVIMM